MKIRNIFFVLAISFTMSSFAASNAASTSANKVVAAPIKAVVTEVVIPASSTARPAKVGSACSFGDGGPNGTVTGGCDCYRVDSTGSHTGHMNGGCTN